MSPIRDYRLTLRGASRAVKDRTPGEPREDQCEYALDPSEGSVAFASEAATSLARVTPPRIPRLVWLSSVTVLALSLLGTLLLPLLIVPDEKHHADMVLMAQEWEWTETGWPGLGERILDPAIVGASLSLGPREAALRHNRAAQHPPLFYLTAALTSSIVTMPVEEVDLTLRLWSFRLVSVVACALLPLTFYKVASELTPSLPIRIAAALVPLTIPGITLRDGAMVNNDSLLLLLTSLATLYAIRVDRGDLSTKTSVGLGVTLGLAALTKGNALVFVPVAVIAYGLMVVHGKGVPPGWVRSVTTSGLTSILIGGWWWIRNIVLYDSLQPIRDLDLPAPTALDWREWIGSATERIVASFWGGQYALGGRPYLPLFWTLSALLVVTVAIGWWKARDRSAATVAGLYALFLVPAVLVVSALLYAERGRVSAVHGRYLFPGVSGVAPLMVLGMAGILRAAKGWLPALMALGSAAMTGLAFQYMLSRYWAADGKGWTGRWLGVLEAAPLPHWMTIGALVLAMASFAALVFGAFQGGMRGRNPA